jgi:HJR/Mrr/RecB family endonuclease
MKIAEIRNFAEIISRLFDSSECLLTDWITANIDVLEEETDNSLTQDVIFDHFADEATANFDKMVKELERIINHQDPINRILITKEIDGTTINLNSLGRKTNVFESTKLRKYFDTIEDWNKNDKGIFYEHFTKMFLIDLGLDADITKVSGDKGIDILAKHKTKLKEDLGQLVFNDYVYLLAQVKFLNKKADTPLVRKLLGDSLLLRFDRIDYVEIAHNAFHLLFFSHLGFTHAALEYARENKIMTMDTEQIISIISSSTDPQNWSCYKFIERSIQDHNIM